VIGGSTRLDAKNALEKLGKKKKAIDNGENPQTTQVWGQRG